MTEILPCPFCGSTDLVLDENSYKCKWVICDGCGATIDDSPHGDCVDLWNRRPTHKPVTDGPPCPTCGFKIVKGERHPFVMDED